jgi:hypothetical protein
MMSGATSEGSGARVRKWRKGAHSCFECEYSNTLHNDMWFLFANVNGKVGIERSDADLPPVPQTNVSLV